MIVSEEMVYAGGIPLLFYEPGKAVLLRNTCINGVWIPAGFCTDGASVPPLARWVISPYTKGLAEALLHDYRYTVGCKTKEARLAADKEYYQGLLATPQLSKWRADAAYRTVRTIGASKYNPIGYEELAKHIRQFWIYAADYALYMGDVSAYHRLHPDKRPIPWIGINAPDFFYAYKAVAPSGGIV